MEPMHLVARPLLLATVLSLAAACSAELASPAAEDSGGKAPSPGASGGASSVGSTADAGGGSDEAGGSNDRGASGTDGSVNDGGASQPDGTEPPPPPPPPPGTRPAWQNGQALNAWRAVPGTKLSSSPPSVSVPGSTGPRSKVVAWCGMAIDTRDSTLYSAANGGHNDYSGNEVNAIRLSDNQPKWIERRAPTPAGQIVYNAGYYSDGRPTSRHSYYAEVFLESKNRVMSFGAGSAWGPGDGKAFVDGFSSTANDWDPAGTYPSLPSFTHPSYAVAKAANEDVYVVMGYRLMRYRPSTNAWTTLTTSFEVYGYETAGAVDTTRNRILFVGGEGNSAGYVYSITNGTGSVASLGISGSALGVVYVPSLDAFLVRSAGAGGHVTRIDAATLQKTSLATTGGASIPSSENGVYTRFAYAPGLGGIVYVPGYESDVYFLRLE